MSATSDAASACLSLAYKYNSLIDCVTDQRPELLIDPTLRSLVNVREMLEARFRERVEALSAEVTP